MVSIKHYLTLIFLQKRLKLHLNLPRSLVTILFLLSSLSTIMLYFRNKIFSGENVALDVHVKKGTQTSVLPAFENLCTTDFVNEKQLDQGHPCVIEVIRTHYLHQVPSTNVPLQLDRDTVENFAISSSNIVLQLLNNKTNGFFIECGAFDGEHGSYTLHLEQNFNWTGVLVEAFPLNFETLYARNRKVWTLPVCLSMRSYPLQAHFLALEDAQNSRIVYPKKSIGGNESIDTSHVINVQCFPLFSILETVGTNKIDFLRLSVAGYEVDILRTIPWHKVHITVMILNLKRSSFHNVQVRSLLSKNGYLETRQFDNILSENDAKMCLLLLGMYLGCWFFFILYKNPSSQCATNDESAGNLPSLTVTNGNAENSNNNTDPS